MPLGESPHSSPSQSSTHFPRSHHQLAPSGHEPQVTDSSGDWPHFMPSQSSLQTPSSHHHDSPVGQSPQLPPHPSDPHTRSPQPAKQRHSPATQTAGVLHPPGQPSIGEQTYLVPARTHLASSPQSSPSGLHSNTRLSAGPLSPHEMQVIDKMAEAQQIAIPETAFQS